jgi:general secretion pathway protein A
MYEDFYGFSEGPFEFGPHPKFLCLTPSHAGALSGMLSGVRERKGITVITGDPGTGKTTLVNALLSELDEKVRTAFIVFTLLEFRDLLKSILAELGIRAQGRDTFALLQKFYLYLSERSQDESVVIIIDEAQGLDTSVLKDLMGLWTGPNPWYLQLQTVLLGQPELEAKLDSQELGSLREKIAVRRHIRPLTRRESNMYIDHRLRIVGSSSSEVFKPEAVDRICDCARGIPRVINMVCDGSLRIGYAKSKRKIDVAIVNEAIEDLRLFKPKEVKGTPPEPLPAEGPRPGESAPERVSARGPRWRTVYQLAVGSLLVTVALGLFALLISDHASWRETKGEGIGTVIAENSSVLSKPNQDLVPVPSTSVKRERPQRLAHKQGTRPLGQRLTYNQGKGTQSLAYDEGKPPPRVARDEGKPPQSLAPYRLNDAELDALVLKQDAAWRVSQR